MLQRVARDPELKGLQRRVVVNPHGTVMRPEDGIVD